MDNIIDDMKRWVDALERVAITLQYLVWDVGLELFKLGSFAFSLGIGIAAGMEFYWSF